MLKEFKGESFSDSEKFLQEAKDSGRVYLEDMIHKTVNDQTSYKKEGEGHEVFEGVGSR